MTIIQILLLLSILILGIWIFSKEFVPWLKVLGFFLIGIGGYFVLFPEHANKVANYLNVGRGADLLLYVFVIAVTFYSISMHQKIKNMERAITKLYRENAKIMAVKLVKEKK